MKNLKNKRVTKLTVKDLKKALKHLDDDKEVVLGLFRKDDPVEFCYLADVYGNLPYNPVERDYNAYVVELVGYDHNYCTYVEKKNEK